MSIYIRLFWEFFKTGLFAIGGGMATLPFLKNIGAVTGWYTQTELMNMVAVSESTPGPIGVNMATYVGFAVAGIPGAVIATIGEITPSIIVILIVVAMLTKFRDSKYVANAFYGLRPASTGLWNSFQWAGSLNYMGLVLAAVLLVLTNCVKATKGWHPIVFIGISAVAGIVLRFGGV